MGQGRVGACRIRSACHGGFDGFFGNDQAQFKTGVLDEAPPLVVRPVRPRDVAGIAAREVARLQEEIVRLRQEQMDWQEVLMKAWVDATLRAERGVEHAP